MTCTTYRWAPWLPQDMIAALRELFPDLRVRYVDDDEPRNLNVRPFSLQRLRLDTGWLPLCAVESGSGTKASAPICAARPMPGQVRAMLQRLQAEVETSCDYVGGEFAEVARCAARTTTVAITGERLGRCLILRKDDATVGLPITDLVQRLMELVQGVFAHGYPEQKLDNDVSMLVRAGNHISMRGQTAMDLADKIVAWPVVSDSGFLAD